MEPVGAQLSTAFPNADDGGTDRALEPPTSLPKSIAIAETCPGIFVLWLGTIAPEGEHLRLGVKHRGDAAEYLMLLNMSGAAVFHGLGGTGSGAEATEVSSHGSSGLWGCNSASALLCRAPPMRGRCFLASAPVRGGGATTSNGEILEATAPVGTAGGCAVSAATRASSVAHVFGSNGVRRRMRELASAGGTGKHPLDFRAMSTKHPLEAPFGGGGGQ